MWSKSTLMWWKVTSIGEFGQNRAEIDSDETGIKGPQNVAKVDVNDHNMFIKSGRGRSPL